MRFLMYDFSHKLHISKCLCNKFACLYWCFWGKICAKSLIFDWFSGDRRNVNLSNYETTCIAGTLKKYLRELPDPVIPEILYPQFVEAASK